MILEKVATAPHDSRASRDADLDSSLSKTSTRLRSSSF
jgi:hypothetical protein